jgi:hypothetical protein
MKMRERYGGPSVKWLTHGEAMFPVRYELELLMILILRFEARVQKVNTGRWDRRGS